MTSTLPPLDRPIDFAKTAPGALAESGPAAMPRSLEELGALLDSPPPRRARHLGDALVEHGLIDGPALQRALAAQRRTHPHRLLGQLLVDTGVFSQAQLNVALAEWLGVHVVDPRLLTPSPEALDRLPRVIAEREGVLPLLVRGDALVAAGARPVGPHAARSTALRQRTSHRAGDRRGRHAGAGGGPRIQRGGGTYRPCQCTARHPGPRGRTGRQCGRCRPTADTAIVSESDNTLVRLVNTLIGEAIERRASDIHIQTVEPPQPVRVRLRIDGDLVHHLELPASYRFALVARLKIMADLDISEHRKPQDGKIDFARFGGPHVELRIVTVPTRHGHEDVVLRLLSGLKPMPLDTIGLSPTQPRRAALGDDPALWPDPDLRPDRLRQDHHAAFGDARAQHRGAQDLDRRRPGRDHAGRAAPGAGQRAHRLDLRRGNAHLPARRPRRDHDRRDARRGDRAHRGRGLADRPPGDVDAAHQLGRRRA